MSTLDDHAFLAVEVLASISRQGLVHPKETGVTLITLGTCPVPKISELAYLEHKALHGKHETVLEREYVKAIQTTFHYHRDVVKDPHGATTNPFNSKLHLMMEVLKMSKSKNRTKFLEKLCQQVDFDVGELDVSEELPQHVQFSRFIIENMSFFEYLTIGELQSTVGVMEKLVTSTGASLAQAIESEIFEVRMDAEADSQALVDGEGTTSQFKHRIDFKRHRQLTSGSMILLSLWEARTYLRRLYGMGTGRREGKTKALSKDLTKSPIKVQGVTGDKFWEDVENIMATALTSRETMTETCKALVELLNVDKELKIAEDDEELNGNGEDPITPSGDERDEDDAPTSGRARKRKATPTSGGRKKRARSSSQLRKRGRTRKQSTVDVDADGEYDDEGEWG
jgi:cohesin loading factor subunit SCC2